MLCVVVAARMAAQSAAGHLCTEELLKRYTQILLEQFRKLRCLAPRMDERQESNNMTDQQDFRTAFKGTFSGVLRWEHLDELWERLRADAGNDWYLYAVGEQPPTETVAGDAMSGFLDQMALLLRKEHEEDYCGIVYVDDVQLPSFVKIFDPNNLGVSCGYSDNPPLPGWILSKLPPVDLQAPVPQPGNRRRWWRRLFAS